MIKELNRNNETNWKEKIQIELSLEDLQIIYDCVGAIPSKYIPLKHLNTKFGSNISKIYPRILNELYEALDTIISEHNGITDNDIMANTEITLEIIEGNE